MKYILLIIAIILLIFNNILKNKIVIKNSHISKLINIFLVIFILEITIFNINSYRLDLKNYEKENYEISSFSRLGGLKYNSINDTYVVTNEIAYIEIQEINKEIATLKIDFEADKLINYKVEYTDITSKDYRGFPWKMCYGTSENEKYIPCFLSGDTSKIRIVIEVEPGTEIKLNGITINVDIPFNFNIIRFCILLIISVFVYGIYNFKLFEESYKENNPKQSIVIQIVFLIFLIILIWCIKTSNKEEFPDDTGINYYIYNTAYVDSILNHKPYLEIEVSDKLKALENPYDYTIRTNNDTESEWDLAYYNEKYYMYFGILPLLLIYIPFKLITGSYLALCVGVFLFSVLASWMYIKLILAITKRWFSEIPFKLVILFIISTLFSSLLLWLCRRPLVYEVVIVAGCYFVLQGIFFMFKALEEEKVKYKYIAFSCSSLALSVACRPTLLISSLIIAPVLIKILIKNIKNKENIMKLILCVGIPYVIVGVLLALYNYIRFDNFLEFGANYQLTINDMRNLKYRLMCIPVGIFSYLFKVPRIVEDFPFFIVNPDIPVTYNYYWTSNMAGGIFFLNPLCLSLLFISKFKKYIKKEVKPFLKVLIIVSIVMCIVNIVMGGNSQRYAVDFMWMFLMAGMIVVFSIYESIKSKEARKWFIAIVLLIVLYIVFSNFMLCAIQSESNWLQELYPKQYTYIKHLICFWE